MLRLPHPIPYQGSKRSLASLIGRYIPAEIETFYEPFAGSAAMTLWAAHHKRARRFVISDSLEPIVELWRQIVEQPERAAARYREIWDRQQCEDFQYFNRIRERYNTDRDPIDLLYLICRCVKNAVRFNGRGAFTQSVDKRRLGMHPDKMTKAIEGAAFLLTNRVEFRCGDWLDSLKDSGQGDFVYMDPPYLGTSIGRDKRYHKQITQETLVEGLRSLGSRTIRFALSYDGSTGDKEYGPPLPDELGLTRLLLHAGRSSQATLQGIHAETIESLYLSERLDTPIREVIRVAKPEQKILELW